MANVFIVNGKSGTGKDTFVDYVRMVIGSTRNVITKSSVDEVKVIARHMGWDSVKSEESRQLLVELKELYVKYFNGPFYYIAKAILNLDKSDVLFVMIREPEEIEKLKTFYPKLKTILVTRENMDRQFSGDNDTNVDKYEYDIVIDNSGTESELRDIAHNFIITHIT